MGSRRRESAEELVAAGVSRRNQPRGPLGPRPDGGSAIAPAIP